jgi:hypothetical protein
MKLLRERRRLLAQSSRRCIFCWAPATEAGVERVAVIFVQPNGGFDLLAAVRFVCHLERAKQRYEERDHRLHGDLGLPIARLI